MRFGMSAAVLAFVLAYGPPAHAQQQQQQSSYVYGGGNTNSVPLYNGVAGSAVRQNAGTASIYNSGTSLQMLPMQQMTSGQPASSYTYNHQRQNAQPYTNYNTGPMVLNPNAMGSLSADQARMIREQRNAQANAYQEQYLEQLRQRDMNNPYLNTPQQQQQMQQLANGASPYQGVQFSQLYADSGQRKPVAKPKVLYNELNNPLVEPPRLFNLQ